jgi:FAD/FMN-containing dehydrogenase
MLIAGDSPVADFPARTLAGGAAALRGTDIQDLAASMRGRVLIAGQDGYDQARRVWNAMFDRRPAVIARCASPSDVMRAVTFAREHQLLTAVRAGGHSLSGKSTCDGGIVIDMTPMQAVRVDPKARTARVEGGALLAHLDRETKAFGLVTTAGTVSHTGAAGLTLGGGFGRVGRRFGLACDNLRSVDIVTADGRCLTASDDENADLFWGVRGGGGNFGVVTSFEYRLHPMDPMILGGPIAWPLVQAREVLQFYSEFTAKAPDELNLDPAIVWGPGGQALVMLEACWSADKAQGERVLQPLRAFGKPVIDNIAAMPYLALQSGGDEHNAPGSRFYSKSGFFTEMKPDDIDLLIEVFEQSPPNRMAIIMQQGGGAIGRKPVNATAFPNRRGNYWVMAASRWQDPALDEQNIATVRSAWKRVEPHTSGFYVNAMADEEFNRVAANYGTNYPRLVQVKKKYDPGNQFRLNANVLPA